MTVDQYTAVIMDMDLKEKIAVVTGGAEGLGYEITNKFLEKNVKTIIILDINEEKASESIEKLTLKYGKFKAVFIKCDVTKDLEVVSTKIFNTYGSIDILVNNAGVANEKSARKTMEINALAVVEWSTKFWEHMRIDKGGKGGTIINVASIYGLRIDPYLMYYKASKFAVVGFSKSLGHEYNFKRSGVRVLTLCPGFTESTLLDNLMPWDGQQEDFMALRGTCPLQKAESVGRAAAEIFERADSGTVWVIEGDKLYEETN